MPKFKNLLAQVKTILKENQSEKVVLVVCAPQETVGELKEEMYSVSEFVIAYAESDLRDLIKQAKKDIGLDRLEKSVWNLLQKILEKEGEYRFIRFHDEHIRLLSGEIISYRNSEIRGDKSIVDLRLMRSSINYRLLKLLDAIEEDLG